MIARPGNHLAGHACALVVEAKLDGDIALFRPARSSRGIGQHVARRATVVGAGSKMILGKAPFRIRSPENGQSRRARDVGQHCRDRGMGSGFPSALWTMPRITVPWDSFTVSRAAGALNAFLVVTDFQPNFETRSEYRWASRPPSMKAPSAPERASLTSRGSSGVRTACSNASATGAPVSASTTRPRATDSAPMRKIRAGAALDAASLSGASRSTISLANPVRRSRRE